MKRKLAFLAAALALDGCVPAIAALAPVCDPAEIGGTNGTVTVTNTVTVPRGMTGWAEVDIVAAALPTNVPAIYTLATLDATYTNVVPVFGVAPLTNAAAVAAIQFQSAAVNSNLLFITTAATNTTRGALLRYTPTYPPR